MDYFKLFCFLSPPGFLFPMIIEAKLPTLGCAHGSWGRRPIACNVLSSNKHLATITLHRFVAHTDTHPLDATTPPPPPNYPSAEVILRSARGKGLPENVKDLMREACVRTPGDIIHLQAL
jgi:hypothetical protein